MKHLRWEWKVTRFGNLMKNLPSIDWSKNIIIPPPFDSFGYLIGDKGVIWEIITTSTNSNKKIKTISNLWQSHYPSLSTIRQFEQNSKRVGKRAEEIFQFSLAWHNLTQLLVTLCCATIDFLQTDSCQRKQTIPSCGDHLSRRGIQFQKTSEGKFGVTGANTSGSTIPTQC